MNHAAKSIITETSPNYVV